MTQPLRAVFVVLYILVLVLVGLLIKILGRGRKIVESIFESINILAIWAILPSIAFVSVVKLGENISDFLMALLTGIFCSSFCLLLSLAISRLRGHDRETMLGLSLNSGFMNVAYLGLPAVYATLESKCMAPAVAFALGVSILHVFLGTLFCNLVTGKGKRFPSLIAEVFSFPAVFATFVGFLFVFLKLYVPENALEFFDLYISPVFLALMLLLTGYLLTVSRPSRHLREISWVSIFRFIVSPAIVLLVILFFRLDLQASMTAKAALLLSITPPGTFNLILAKNFRQNLEFYGAILFHTTLLFTFLVLPLFSALML
jgi:predicted permease